MLIGYCPETVSLVHFALWHSRGPRQQERFGSLLETRGLRGSSSAGRRRDSVAGTAPTAWNPGCATQQSVRWEVAGRVPVRPHQPGARPSRHFPSRPVSSPPLCQGFQGQLEDLEKLSCLAPVRPLPLIPLNRARPPGGMTELEETEKRDREGAPLSPGPPVGQVVTVPGLEKHFPTESSRRSC